LPEKIGTGNQTILPAQKMIRKLPAARSQSGPGRALEVIKKGLSASTQQSPPSSGCDVDLQNRINPKSDPQFFLAENTRKEVSKTPRKRSCTLRDRAAVMGSGIAMLSSGGVTVILGTLRGSKSTRACEYRKNLRRGCEARLDDGTESEEGLPGLWLYGSEYGIARLQIIIERLQKIDIKKKSFASWDAGGSKTIIAR